MAAALDFHLHLHRIREGEGEDEEMGGGKILNFKYECYFFSSDYCWLGFGNGMRASWLSADAIEQFVS
jgi:hypothetical protein